MKFSLKKELVYCEDKAFPFIIGHSLCTVYIESESKYNPYKLYNFGYSLNDKDFYINKNFHMSKRIIRYFERSTKSIKIENEMHSNNIYRMDEVITFIENYGNDKFAKVLQKKKNRF